VADHSFGGERGLRGGSFVFVIGMHLLAAWAILSLARSEPMVSGAKPLFVEFIAPEVAPEPLPPMPEPPPKPVEKPKPKPIITTKAKTAEPPPMEAPPEPQEPEPLPPIQATPPPQPGPPEPAPVEPPRFDMAYLNNPPPVYPAVSRRMAEEGTVKMNVLVSAQGRALKVEIHTSSGYSRLDQAALNAVRHWKFVPAKRGDTPVEGWALVPLVFVLNQ
jgi:protein TonB